MVTVGGLLQPAPMHSSTCWCSVQLPLGLIRQERRQIVIFPRLWPFCVFEIVLWVFGFEGGLAERPELPLLSSNAVSASVVLLARKGSVLTDVITTTSWCFVVLVDREEASGNLRDNKEAILSWWGPKLGFAVC